MDKILYIVLTAVLLFGNSNNEYSIEEKLHNGQTITLENNRYKILEFSKRIVNIRLSSSEYLSVNFETSKTTPFSKIKVFAKKVGNVNALITFSDNSVSQIVFNITNDIRDIKKLVKNISNSVEISQVNETIILKGAANNNKLKNKIISIVKDIYGDTTKIIDLIKIEEPDKMVRLKLYVAEINNNKGETIKNNWSMYSGFDSGKGSISINSEMLNSVTLSGGITAIASRMGSMFDAGLTLNYLKKNGVARLLDETMLITLENKASEFLAGGVILVETSSTSAEGLPVTAISEINYGLQLNINVKEIIKGRYINLEIDTSSSTLDPTNGVGSMPATKEKSIKTNVLIENESTIVLGGLINNTNSKDMEKVPLLGDVPILGKLFQSKDFQAGNSELVFFITPIIVDPSVNDQNNKYKSIKNTIIEKKDETIKIEESDNSFSNEELHKQRVQTILGI